MSDMIKLRVDELAAQKGIPNANQLSVKAKALGLVIHTETASQLWNNRIEKIALKTINALCIVLDCKPGELFTGDAERAKKARKK